MEIIFFKHQNLKIRSSFRNMLLLIPTEIKKDPGDALS